ncbi:unnamed protein product [Rotaria sp. Silwood2]|nr:unnamed protein product [Rotaria sp. Silwood2]CAF3392518.1 unnamed protein product [Rotaria sp. Silwood2]CAF3514727.1 unnamed protein product [Rotaria sp. Silwood2]
MQLPSLKKLTVRIFEGSYKDYVGIVNDGAESESICKIGLQAKCQIITVDRNRIVSTSNVSRQSGEMPHYYRIFLYGSQASSYATLG